MSHYLQKGRQTRKLAEIRLALVACGLCSIDKQAAVLGLSRSTAYHVITAAHKNTGISARIIGRMLDSPRLPPSVRAILCEYAVEKAAGLYGSSSTARRRFRSAMSEVAEVEK
jgi:hypothetical protein